MFVSDQSTLISPYGGSLLDLTVPVDAFDGLKAYASHLPSVQISPRSVGDLELLATGAFSPLDRFMGQKDYHRVLEEMRLANGQSFPIPVTLPVEASHELHLDRDIALRGSEYELLGVMTIEEIYPWDRAAFAGQMYGTQDERHPMLAGLQRWGDLNISGRLQVIHLPNHYDFQDLRLTPSQTRARLSAMGNQNVAAYLPDNRLPPEDTQSLEAALAEFDGTLLLQLAAGLVRPGDMDHYTRVRIYKALAERCLRPGRVLLSLLPLAGRQAGVRETLLQALVCRNYGASHMLVRQNTGISGCFSEPGARDIPQETQFLGEKVLQDLGLQFLPVPRGSKEMPATSGVQQGNGHASPGGCIHDEVAEILAEAYPPRHQQGVCIWFTGLSGSGKSTTAEILTWLLMEHGRRVTVLDGDVVRTHLSKGLGFSKEDRDTNVRRIGYVASELVRVGGVVICSVVSPYRAARGDVRGMVGTDHFVEVFVDTPLAVCEARDVKGMYAKARRGGLKGFTGIDDPYEPPEHPELILDTVTNTPRQNASRILAYLIDQGFVRAS